MTQKEEKLLDHNYDGIQELDNPLPKWWINMFYLTIIFSIVYFTYYTFGFGPSQQEELQADMNTGNANKTQAAITFTDSKETIAAGKAIFVAKCGACHGQEGQGGIGPNLTDKYWIHGGTQEQIFQTIKIGVPEKGMIAWATQLADKDISNLVVYIQSLQDTNPPNPKEPQGDPL